MITFIVFMLAAVCAVEAVLSLALLGLVIVELSTFCVGIRAARPVACASWRPGRGGFGPGCPA